MLVAGVWRVYKTKSYRKKKKRLRGMDPQKEREKRREYMSNELDKQFIVCVLSCMQE